MPFGSHLKHRSLLFRRKPGRSDQSIPLSHQKVPDIESDGHPVGGMQGLFAVALIVFIFDVIMNQRGLVETFHRHADAFEILRPSILRCFHQRLHHRSGEKRTPSLTGPHQPFARQFLSLSLGFTHDQSQGSRGETKINLLPKGTQIQAQAFILAGQMDVIPDPIQIDRGVDAIILQQGDGDARYRSGLHVGKGALQNAQAADPDDGFNLSSLNQGHHNRRPLGHQHGVTQTLGFILKILNRTQSTLLAEKTKLIEWGRALAFHAKAFG